MIRFAMMVLSLASPASLATVPNETTCVASIEILRDISDRVEESSIAIGFMLRQSRPDSAYMGEAMAAAEPLVGDGERQIDAMVANCGSGVLDWAAELRSSLGDLRDYLELGRLVLPETDPRHPVWAQRREIERARDAARAEFARMRARRAAD
jgi:hypothetical protein